MAYQRRFVVVSALAAITGGGASATAGSLTVGEHSFENPVLGAGVQGWPFVVVPSGGPDVPAYPNYPWIGTELDTGLFYNPSQEENPEFPGEPTGYLDNMDGNQAAYIGGSEGNEFYQMLSVNYAGAQAYTLRVGVAESLFVPPVTGGSPPSIPFVRAELFYVDGSENRQTVATMNISDNAATGLRNDHFKYFQVSSPVISNTPPIGKAVGILFSMGGKEGGYFDLDDVSVITSSQPTISASWNTNANGNWSQGSNWTGGVAPNGADHLASFDNVLGSPRTVTLDGPKTLGILNLSSSFSYTIAGGALTLDVSAGKAMLNVTAGTHTISAPVVVNDNLTITSAVSSGVAITGPLTATGQSITKTGLGSFQFENVRAVSLNVTGGLVRIRAKTLPNDFVGTSVVNSLSINPGAQLDLTNNSLVIDYTAPVGSLLNNLRLDLQSGRLTSTSATSTRGLGYADNAILGRTSFAGLPVDSDSLLIKYTYFGDSNLDGKVDIRDLQLFAANFLGSGKFWSNGDFDYNGTVDRGDLGLLARNWQAGVANPLGGDLSAAMASLGLPTAVIPEPVAPAVVLLAAVAVKRRRRQA